MLHLFHMDVAKVDRGVLHMLHMFQRHVARVCFECLRCFKGMFHLCLRTHVAIVFMDVA